MLSSFSIKYIINSAISLVADLYLTLHSNEITFSFTIYAEKISTSVAWNYYLIHLEENRRKKRQEDEIKRKIERANQEKENDKQT